MTEPAFLYVIADGSGAHKVGLSKSPKRRLSQLQVGNPRRLTLVRSSAGRLAESDEVEAYAHWLLRESCVRGEWFDVTEEAAWVALIAAVEAVEAGLRAPAEERVTGRKQKLPNVMPVRFREGTFAKIDGVAGENRRAAFIREAVEEALKRAARKPAKG